MSLKEYKQKRQFGETPEPEESTRKHSGGERIFVVQKHQASHLHYDFRLELNGVLKSWAVPKGPSMNPEEKRLAVMVEDHPLDYGSFTGTIPEGLYGAGTVEIWDKGTWEPEKEGSINQALRDGLLEFTLKGEKLNGSFVLVRTDGTYTKNGWLLIKREDDKAVNKKYDANKIPVFQD